MSEQTDFKSLPAFGRETLANQALTFSLGEVSVEDFGDFILDRSNQPLSVSLKALGVKFAFKS